MSDYELEQRVASLEAQAGLGQGGGQQGGGQEALVQAFLQGALTAYAASQQPQAQGLAGGGFAGAQGLWGWTPTRYDSRFWCRSRFMCNPQSISCLC